MQEKRTYKPRSNHAKKSYRLLPAQILSEPVSKVLGLDVESTNNRLLNRAIDAFESDPTAPGSDVLLNKAMRIIEKGKLDERQAFSAMSRLLRHRHVLVADKIARKLIRLANKTKDVWIQDEAVKNVMLMFPYLSADMQDLARAARQKNAESLNGVIRYSINQPKRQENLRKAIESLTAMIGELEDQEALLYVAWKSTDEYARITAVEKLDNINTLLYVVDKSDYDDTREAVVNRFARENNISVLQSLALNTRHLEMACLAREALDAMKDTVDSLKPPIEKVARIPIHIDGEPGDTIIDHLPSVAGEISQAEKDASGQEPVEQKVIVRDSVILDLFGSDITAVYSAVLRAREGYNELNKEYWRLIERYNRNGQGGEQIDYDTVLHAYGKMIEAWDRVQLEEQKYDLALRRISQELEEEVDVLERRLLGEIAYKKEIEYRLGNAHEDLIHAQQDGDEEAVSVAGRAVFKYENILQKLTEKGRWQDSISETDYSIERSPTVASRQQDKLELDAVQAYQAAKIANEGVARIDEAIEKGHTIMDSPEGRILARAEYKEVLDRLRAEYGGTAYERIHDLVEKRANYEEAILAAYAVFKAEIDNGDVSYSDILEFGERIISSGEYPTSPSGSKERFAAEIFHASFELEHARELLVNDPMQTIQLEKCNVPLRGGSWLGEMNTMMWFDDMIKHMQSDPPTPEQLQGMTKLRKSRQHKQNRELNQDVWEIMSREFVDEEQHESCPIVVTVPKDLTVMQADGVYANSHYIAIKENRELDADDRTAIMAHEQAHYLAALNGGLGAATDDGRLDMIWQVGKRRVKGATWIHEGLTELLTQQLIRKHGIRSKRVGYPGELIKCFYLQKLVGEDVLKKAYLSGDFTKVMNMLDEKLGYGTFDELLGKINFIAPGSALTRALDHFNINYKSWENDGIVQIAIKQLAES